MTIPTEEIEFQQQHWENLSGSLRTKNDFLKGKQTRLDAVEIAQSIIKKPISGNIIDIGAGTGYLSACLLETYPDANATLVESNDASSALIEKCMSCFLIENTRFNIQICDFSSLREIEFYDYAFAMGALHHSYNLDKSFASIFRSLKPGGYLIAHEPSFSDDFSVNDARAFYREHLPWPEPNSCDTPPRYDFFFRNCEYRALATRNHFDLITWKRHDPPQRKKKGMLKNFFTRRSNSQTLSTREQYLGSYLMIWQKPADPTLWQPHADLLGGI